MARDRWEKYDVVAKILLGAAGLCLSAVLAWGEWVDRSEESARKVAEADSAREESYAREFQTYYALARQPNTTPELALSDLDIAGAIAQTLAAKPFERVFYSDAVLALRTRFEPDADSGGPSLSPGTSPVELQSREAAAPPNALRGGGEWFAVIASYPLTQSGRDLADQRARSVSSALGCVEVWSTMVSRNYAVVVGSKTNRATALANAQRARRLGVARDAFTQVDRQWRQLTHCSGG